MEAERDVLYWTDAIAGLELLGWTNQLFQVGFLSCPFPEMSGRFDVLPVENDCCVTSFHFPNIAACQFWRKGSKEDFQAMVAEDLQVVDELAGSRSRGSGECYDLRDTGMLANVEACC